LIEKDHKLRPIGNGGDVPFEWYIQHTPMIVQSNGTWHYNAFFGNAGDIGCKFEIIAIVTSANLKGIV
jgi:hypothetical protein